MRVNEVDDVEVLGRKGRDVLDVAGSEGELRFMASADDECATVDSECPKRCGDDLRPGRIGDEAFYDDERAFAGVAAEHGTKCEPAHLGRQLLGEAMGTRAVRDASADIFHDKNTIKADPFVASNVYAIWGRLEADGHGPAWFTRSTDRGATWEPSRGVYDPGPVNQTLGNGLDVLPNGTLINVFLEIIRSPTPANAFGQRVRVMSSNDKGVNWSVPVTVAEYLGVGTVDPDTRLKVRDSSGVPQVAVGKDGRIHVVWQDARFSGGVHDGVAYSRSGDGGMTWSEPVRVNARTDVAAFVPMVHIRDDGIIGVSYYDFRDNTTSLTTLPTAYRLAVSADGVNWRESEVNASFDLATAPIASGLFLGDYQALSSNGAAFSALYARTTGAATNNATEIVFANVADGSLKRAAGKTGNGSYRAALAPNGFAITAELSARVRANLERAIMQRKEKFRQFSP